LSSGQRQIHFLVATIPFTDVDSRVAWQQFTPVFVTANPGVFLNLASRAASSVPGACSIDKTINCSCEDGACRTCCLGVGVAGQIRTLHHSLPPPRQPVRTRELLEDDTEVIEILSSEDELEVEASLRPTGASSDPPEPPSPLLLPFSDPPDPLELSDDELEGSGVILLSPTSCYDPNIIFRVILGPAEINRQKKLQHVEYLKDIPPYFPVFREPTAIVIDMRDDPNSISTTKRERSWRRIPSFWTRYFYSISLLKQSHLFQLESGLLDDFKWWRRPASHLPYLQRHQG
jgi:hypothetical protein